MYTNTLSKFRLFGKIGKVIMTALSVIAALITVSCCILTAFIATLPEDALSVRVVEHTELRFGTETFGTLWNILGGSFTYSGDHSPESMLESKEKHITPPEDQEFQTELKLFSKSYDSAKIRSEDNTKIMEAEATPAEYNAKSLIPVFACITLFAASAAVSLWVLRNLFSVLKKGESPFCGDVVRIMRSFGFSLLPVALFASASETLLASFLAAGKSSHVSIQWGILIAFIVTMALVAVFKYGVQLQKESDETL